MQMTQFSFYVGLDPRESDRPEWTLARRLRSICSSQTTYL